ncbi:MAG: hypothetical protein EHM13_12015 [Acidobacteria bacterium]|nr:MAG: hypothetical protein EHM13_12015 [Acidobacteriota bacterium]
MPQAVVEISGLVKNYGGLRPLRLRKLAVHQGEIVTVSGLDHAAAEALTNLILGATLPDSGEVRVLGRSTRLVSDADAWLALVDRIGLVSDRVVLLEELTVGQNLAVPFSLDLDPVPEDVARAAWQLAGEVGLSEEEFGARLSTTTPVAHLKVRVARSLALNPQLVVLEHPTAALADEPVIALASALRQIARTRELGALALTSDRSFAQQVADKVLSLRPATGDLVPISR